MVLAKWGPDVNPIDLPDALQVLTFGYAFSLGLCLLAAMVDMLGIFAVVSWLKSGFNRRSYHNSWGSNPLINATSVVVLGGLLTVAANSSLEVTIIRDFKVAREQSKNGGLQPASLADAERGLDSLLAFALACKPTRTVPFAQD